MTETMPPAIDFRSFEPYYAQLKRILLKDLEAGGAEGSLLPSVAELCAQYSVSRTVVRQALVDMTDGSLYQVLRESYGVRPASGHRAIEAVALSKEDAASLGVVKGAPGLRMHSVTRSGEGVLFEHFVAHYRGDSFRFELEIHSR